MNAKKDQNDVSTLIAVLATDGQTIIAVQADPVTHRLKVSDGTTGTDNGPDHALKDDNNVSTLLAVSSVDGKTIVPIYSNSSGQLLVKST